MVILDPALSDLAGSIRYDPARWTHRLAHRRGSSGQHFLFGDSAFLHRIFLRGAPGGGALAALVPCDAMIATRLQAVSDFDRWMLGTCFAVSAARPTFYQGQRLDLLLSILDLRRERPTTSHEIAHRLLYRRMEVGRGAVWKSSPERRRTQRLIGEAEALAAGGYRALLAGPAGRQK